jgi:LysR family transcriptional activator of nhaA
MPNLDWLNYHHLRYFWTVAKEGSVRRAAERLHVSSPSISAQLRELETALDARLFRRSGRTKVLTEAGQLALRYADEIFSLGGDLLSALRQQPTARAPRLYVGVVDSFPKLLTFEILKPAFADDAIHVFCREGKSDDLLAQLAVHRLDLVLADEPASSGLTFSAFNHRLGGSGVTFCAIPALAARLRRRFPASLERAPALLPAESTPLRRSIDAWFRSRGIAPRVRADFDDLALMATMATQAPGVVPIPSVVLAEARERYGLVKIGEAEGCRHEFYAITAERKITHPVLSQLTEQAQKLVFG